MAAKKWFPVLLVLFTSVELVAGDFGAYYTRLDYQDGISDRHADIIVEFAKDQRFVFSRQSSYLPYWETEKGKSYVKEVIPRSGDGTDIQPDKYNRHSYVRIIESSPERVIIHWRYYPDLLHTKMTDVVHEVFAIEPDGKVTRRIKKGTQKIDDWYDPANVSVQILQLGKDGIKEISFKQARTGKKSGGAVEGAPVKDNGIGEAAAHWRFDEGQEDFAKESFSGIDCPITGPKSYWVRGVSGTALQFDGYTSSVSLPVEYGPHVVDEMTVEAWVAMAAHPFGWVPIVHQCVWEKVGFYFGVNAYGKVGLMVAADGEWKELISEDKLELARWTHIAATVNAETGKFALYIDGAKNAEGSFEGERIQIANVPIIIGLNREPLIPLPRARYGRYGQKVSITGFEGAIDEVRMCGGVLDDSQIQRSYQNLKPDASVLNNPGFEKRVLPGHPGRVEKFGAFYTKLKYHELWDNLWRSSDYADIVVKFDESPASVVFWRGPSYGPGWVTEKNYWMADQGVETGNAISYSEHMSDKQGRYAHVRLIENTDARVVVHWRYSVCDVTYNFDQAFGPAGIWDDEYFHIYPDGVAIRKVNQKSLSFTERPPTQVSWQDVQFFAGPGMTPDDVMNLDAVTLANMKGETAIMDWTDGVPQEQPLRSANIERINFKSDYKVFLAFQDGTYINPWGRVPRDMYCHFMTWNHWPVAMIASQGKSSLFPDRVTHSALCAADNAIDHGNMAMYGFTDKPITALFDLVKSWCNPPSVKKTEGCQSKDYDKAQRAYILNSTSDDLSFRLEASKESPVVNPCFVIKNWNSKSLAHLELNGKKIEQGKTLRQGIVYDTDGTRTLVVWAKIASTEPMRVSINPISSLSINEVRKLGGKMGFKAYDANPVLTVGAPGEWDAGALGSMTVIEVGSIYHLYYEAWGVRSEKEWDAEEYESLQIGHATSKDGVHWTKDPANPVLLRGAPGEWDRTGTWDPFVLYEGGLFKMWYGGGGGGKPCDWAFAVSNDGSHFEKKGRISFLKEVEDDHIVHDTDTGLYHMYYWDRNYEPMALFHATSKNETDFDFESARNIKIAGETYPEQYKFTHVLKDTDGWHMFYGDFERPHCPDTFTRYATSSDGVHWRARNKRLLEGHDADVLKVANDLYLMYYGPRNYFDAKDCDIRLAVYNGKLSDLAR